MQKKTLPKWVSIEAKKKKHLIFHNFNQISTVEVGASKNGNDKIDEKIM